MGCFGPLMTVLILLWIFSIMKVRYLKRAYSINHVAVHHHSFVSSSSHALSTQFLVAAGPLLVFAPPVVVSSVRLPSLSSPVVPSSSSLVTCRAPLLLSAGGPLWHLSPPHEQPPTVLTSHRANIL
ncbi:hypothetical protein ACOSQ3_024539 [Xanthoceras sorbifolium]